MDAKNIVKGDLKMNGKTYRNDDKSTNRIWIINWINLCLTVSDFNCFFHLWEKHERDEEKYVIKNKILKCFE